MNKNSLTEGKSKKFHRSVLNWSVKYGRHELPWQNTNDPYLIWISEIMLQQTQVKTVIPYYLDFVKTFPNLKNLANENLDAVLSQWTGLGYYARARNLYKAAQVIEFEKNGKFPQNYDDLIKLPGIGRSTAGAILSFAFNQRYAILDANVRRVLARFFGVDGEPSKTKTKILLWKISEFVLPRNGREVAKFNQAIMDLGALICTRRNPNCACCPLSKNCHGKAIGNPEYYPTRVSKRIKPVKYTKMVILVDKNERVLLERRPDKGIWGGLWSFPESSFENNLESWCAEKFGFNVEFIEELDSMTHGFSHFTLFIKPLVMRVCNCRNNSISNVNYDWVSPNATDNKGLSAPVKLLLNKMDSMI